MIHVAKELAIFINPILAIIICLNLVAIMKKVKFLEWYNV
ncbi:hypothetical protein SAMN05518872_1259 [Psychrobacillus sp. OK032]|nr:hypothetical protein SAMN05518872_1259 [Psychrobacillus sp. OK032]